MKQISKAQKVQFDLLRMTCFNSFEGKLVADSLEKHDDLWQGFVFGSFSCAPLLVLCSIDIIDEEAGGWNASELYIIPAKGKEKELKELAKTWGPDELGYQSEKEIERLTCRDGYTILRAWWD